ncbi:GtrA family protein [Actinomadura sp. WMMB 499]|uniref:GtrA family protein n=1 Tax=Actinomadura sp. WMMB 499 TaxID=1219491 RepID=UPI0020C7AEF5|nr:GtrA family protein [Actinomadura sp. WMMB 499]
MNLVASLQRQFQHLVRELAKFGSVGAIAFAITMIVSNVLHAGLDVGPMTSFLVATVVATTFSYLANRYWTFRHRDRSGVGREYVIFFALNGVGLVITQLFIGFTIYVLSLEGTIPYNTAMIVGTGAATLFRFWAYKKWVFLPAGAPPVAPASGLPEPVDGHEPPDGVPGAHRADVPAAPRLGHPLDAPAEDYAAR